MAEAGELFVPKVAVSESYAGFWIRAVAFFVDCMILSLLMGLVNGFLFGRVFVFSGGMMMHSGMMMSPGFFPLVGIVVPWLYFALFESSAGQATLGKKLCELQVTTLSGNRISFKTASLRFFAKYLSFFFCFFGFLMVLFTQRKQGLHDKIADTLVLKRPTTEKE